MGRRPREVSDQGRFRGSLMECLIEGVSGLVVGFRDVGRGRSRDRVCYGHSLLASVIDSCPPMGCFTEARSPNSPSLVGHFFLHLDFFLTLPSPVASAQESQTLLITCSTATNLCSCDFSGTPSP